jgi:hypothetical protein
MRIRRVLIALFALGTVGGYGSAIATSACHARARQAAFERHAAHLCADAARTANARDPRAGDDEVADEDQAYRPW